MFEVNYYEAGYLDCKRVILESHKPKSRRIDSLPDSLNAHEHADWQMLKGDKRLDYIEGFNDALSYKQIFLNEANIQRLQEDDTL